MAFGRFLAVVGVLIAVAGMVFMAISRFRGWPLPGDLLIRRGRVTLFVPLVTSILLSLLLSVVLSVVFSILARWRR